MTEKEAAEARARLKVGDYIECHDKEEMLKGSIELGKAGIQTDFVYEMNGEGGLWLVVTEVEDGAD